MVQNLDLAFDLGETWEQSFAATNPDGTPVDLTSATVSFTANTFPAAITANCTITNAAGGLFSLSINSVTTSSPLILLSTYLIRANYGTRIKDLFSGLLRMRRVP